MQNNKFGAQPESQHTLSADRTFTFHFFGRLAPSPLCITTISPRPVSIRLMQVSPAQGERNEASF